MMPASAPFANSYFKGHELIGPAQVAHDLEPAGAPEINRSGYWAPVMIIDVPHEHVFEAPRPLAWWEAFDWTWVIAMVTVAIGYFIGSTSSKKTGIFVHDPVELAAQEYRLRSDGTIVESHGNCPNCGAPVEPEWDRCGYCMTVYT